LIQPKKFHVVLRPKKKHAVVKITRSEGKMEEVDEIDHEGYSPHRETDDDFYAQDSCKKYEGIYKKIKALESLVVEKHRSQIACVVMYDITQKPFLKVSLL